MYSPKNNIPLKPYQQAIVFSDNDLLLMDAKALVLFGKASQRWWKTLIPIEKHRILTSDDTHQIKQLEGNSTQIQQL